MILVLGEKPSVSRDIARVVGASESKNGCLTGNGYIVSSFVGHLVSLASPQEYDEKYSQWDIDDLPIIPDKFLYRPLPDKEEILKKLTKLMNSPDVDSIICATDAGREGEVIFRYVYDYIGCKKPYKRLWISSLTDESIRQGMDNLVEGKENLFKAGAARAQVDWLIGMNLSRLYSHYFGTNINIGRVMTAALNMIVQRDKEITEFVKKPFYKLILENGAEWFSDDNNCISEKSEAIRIKTACEGKTASVVKADKAQRTENRPLLYSLTSLQMDANDNLGFSAAKTLTIMQSLYEKKLLTYPRTESSYLTEDMKTEIPVLVQLLGSYDVERVRHFNQVGLNIDSRVIDNSKVSDHHAIIPTKSIGSYENAGLTEDEKAVLDMVIKRFFLVLEQPYTYEETTYVFEVEGERFSLKTRSTINLGWREFVGGTANTNARYEVGSTFQINKDTLFVKECASAPPKPITESSLLGTMENIDRKIGDKELKKFVKARGLGTTATRAAIIEKLIEKGYVQREKKALVATEKGKFLIERVPEIIKNAEMTANLESMLYEIENGSVEPETVIEQTEKLIREVMEIEKTKSHDKFGKSEKAALGKCPKCGGNVFEGSKSYYCENYKADSPCNFSVFKENNFFSTKKKSLTAVIMKKLLEDRKALINSCFSPKNGKTYDAWIGFDEYTGKDGKQHYGFKILEFKGKENKK